MRLHILIVIAVSAFSMRDCSAEVPVGVMSVWADYGANAGRIDKARVLNGSQGGYEAMANRNWFPQALPKLKAAGLRMIRLDHLLSDKFYRVVSRDESGKIQCRFDRLDGTILSIARTGMTPLMCLCYCPDALIPPGGSDASHPGNLAEWKEIVGRLVSHYRGLGHGGLYWEVWNEPDAKFFYAGTQKEYLELYLATAEAVRAADPMAKVGGAADANFQAATAQIGPLLDYIKAHPATPLDFMSYHWYGGCTRDEKPPYDLEWGIDRAAAMFKARGLAGREIFIDEWNTSYVMDAGPGADSDTHRAAAGVAARIFNALEHPEIARIFYFAPLEGYRPHRLVNGDLGLLTVNYHKKAVYNVFQMVHQLGDVRLKTIVRGPNSEGHPIYALATKDASTGAATVMLWNYSDSAINAEMSLDHLPWPASQNLKVIQYQIDADHANYFSDYRTGLRGYSVTPREDLDPLECRVVESVARFTRTTTLPPFSVVQFVIEPAQPGVALGVLPMAKAIPAINLAAGKPVLASSSLEKGGWGKQRLVDEIAHSLPGALGWSSASSATADHAEWVGVDLGGPTNINAVRICPRDDENTEGGLPPEYRVQVAEDLDHWTDAAREAGNRQAREPAEIQFADVRCRYVRVYVTRLPLMSYNRKDYGFQLAELEVYSRSR